MSLDSSEMERGRPVDSVSSGIRVIMSSITGDEYIFIEIENIIPHVATFPRFRPKNGETPSDLFRPGIPWRAKTPALRYMRVSDPRQLLIFIDGYCLNNGFDNAQAGCAFTFCPQVSLNAIPTSAQGVLTPPLASQTLGSRSWRLELCGPTGVAHPQTSNRADLRAVIGAIDFRRWNKEGFKRLVIATDSEYVVNGATRLIHKWRANAWKKEKRGEAIANQDLWKELIRVLTESRQNNLETAFWCIPHHLNSMTEALAKNAAKYQEEKMWRALRGDDP